MSTLTPFLPSATFWFSHRTHSPSPSLFSVLAPSLSVCPCAVSRCPRSLRVPPAASGPASAAGHNASENYPAPVPPFGSLLSSSSGSSPCSVPPSAPKFTLSCAFTLLPPFRILHFLVLHFLCRLLLPFHSLLPPSFSPFPLSPHTITRFLWFPGCSSGAGAAVPSRVNDVSLIYFLPYIHSNHTLTPLIKIKKTHTMG